MTSNQMHVNEISVIFVALGVFAFMRSLASVINTSLSIKDVMRGFIAVVLCIPCVLACVEHGYGVQNKDKCEIRYCNEGYFFDNETCVPCKLGTYSDSQDLEPCLQCQIPIHSQATRYGETTSSCKYKCHSFTFGQECHTLYAVTSIVFFVSVTFLSLLILNKKLERKRKAF